MSAQTGKIAQALSSVGRLSSRERMLIGVTVMAAVLFVFAGGTWFVKGRLNKAERRLAEREAQLQQILALEGQYRRAELERKRSKSMMVANSTQLFSLLPKVAGELGLTLNDLNERRSPLKDSGIDEISVDVNLRQMSIDKLDAFLEKVETTQPGGLVKVLKLKVKTRYDNAELLDVTMKVATYKPSESS